MIPDPPLDLDWIENENGDFEIVNDLLDEGEDDGKKDQRPA